ncbi:MAG: DNA polymerase III subunit beta, partial [Caldisericia bacterium]|nr:DNA polymerase III subunit beta [Caldisericia bacterium]
DIQIEIGDGSQMIMRSSKAKVTLNCADASDYPRIPEMTSGDKVIIDRDTLLGAVDRVTPALSDRMEDKRELLGALVSIRGGTFNLVGTDGQRLAICEVPTPGSPEVEVIVAGTVWRNLAKLIGEGENSDVGLAFSQNQVGFEFGNVKVVSRLIDGEYPPYRQVVPAKFEYKVIVDMKTLLSALQRVNIIVRQSSRKVTIAARDGELVCKGIAPEIGEVEEKIEATTDGADVELSFDIKKLIDGIKGTTGPQVQININGPLHPVLIQTENDDTYKYILVTQR